MASKKNQNSFPSEVEDFFSKPGGRSLLIKGRAGTGKTTFALQLLEEITSPDRGFYLTTRVSDEAIYNQFPWLKDTEMRNRIIDSGRVLLESLIPAEGEDEVDEPVLSPDEEFRIQSARSFLDSIGDDEEGPPTVVDRTHLSDLLANCRMPEVERIYDRVDMCLPDKPLFVIDSVEGITHKYNIEPEELIFAIQKDLVEHSNTNLVLVLEKAEAPDLEYLVDGVLSLERRDFEGRRVRNIHLGKLRATEIRQPDYLLTLQYGRFKCFEPFPGDWDTRTPWEVIPDSDNKYSTGIPDLDTLLDGGFRKGSYNVIEIGENVSDVEADLILRSIWLNFVSQNRGIVAVLTGGVHPDSIREDCIRFIEPSFFDENVRIADYFQSTSNKEYVMALNREKKEAYQVWKENMAKLRGDGTKPIMDYTGFDTLEYLRGDTIAIKDLLNAVAKTKNSNDLGIGVVKPGLKLTQEIMNMADSYLKIVDIHKCPCIFGTKPKTPIHAISVNREKGFPFVSLNPIV